MTLAPMREHGVRSVAASCRGIGGGDAGSVDADHLPMTMPVPDGAPPATLELRIAQMTSNRA